MPILTGGPKSPDNCAHIDRSITSPWVPALKQHILEEFSNKGLQAIKPEPISDLITIDNQYLDRVTIRRNTIAEYKNTVHGCLPGGESAVHELYSYLLTHHLPTRFSNLFALNGEMFHNKITGRSFPTTPPQDPETCLRILGETVEEDIFLLKETEITHICLAFTCCFPTGFDPSSKLGLDLRGIHGPVPAYEKIGPSMERFFRKLEVGKSVKRMNVSSSNFVEFDDSTLIY